MKFTRIPENTFKEIQLNAGVLLDSFNPSSPSPSDSDIIAATSGGINFTATPSFTDFGEDIDNCPKNTMELKRIDDWEVKMTGSFATNNSSVSQKLVGSSALTASTIATGKVTDDTTVVSGKQYYTRSGTSPNYTYTATTPSTTNPHTEGLYEAVTYSPATITPKRDLSTADFHDLWFVGDYSDKNGSTNGGFVAIKMLNSLSTGGFQFQTTDKAKTKYNFEFTGHYSISSPDTVPFIVYIQQGAAEPTT